MQVVIKDFVSRAVVSQFKAHASPISALCFDPSGTMLVTASVHGNNINIFRILPSSSQCDSGSQNFNWNSAHVHLYKLHRGMTSAVCFPSFLILVLFLFYLEVVVLTHLLSERVGLSCVSSQMGQIEKNIWLKEEWVKPIGMPSKVNFNAYYLPEYLFKDLCCNIVFF